MILHHTVKKIQGISSVSLGDNAGKYWQGDYSIAIGKNCGKGDSGGTTNQQGTKSVAIGFNVGLSKQGDSSIGIGKQAAQESQGNNAIALGLYAGQMNQEYSSISIGNEAGRTSQSSNSIAFGTSAGQNSQGSKSIAIGFKAGEGIEDGQGQHNNSIIFNATDISLNSDGEERLFIKPIRNIIGDVSSTFLQYDLSSGEITHHKDLNMPWNSRIMFNNGGANENVVGPNMIKLWSSDQYGFGIDSDTLKYCSATHHKFYHSGSDISNGTLGMHLNNSDLTVHGKVQIGVNNSIPEYELDIKGISHTGAEGFHSGNILHYYPLNSLNSLDDFTQDFTDTNNNSINVVNDYVQLRNTASILSPALDITGYSAFKENGTYTADTAGNNKLGYTSQRILVKLSAAFYSQDYDTDYFSIELLNGSDGANDALISEIYKVYNSTQSNSIGFNPIVCDITPYLTEGIETIKIKLISTQPSDKAGEDFVHVKNLTVCVDDSTPWYQFSAKQATFTDKVGIGTTTPQANLHISSGNSGDCTLILEADTDNNNETDNPQILFRQDGGKDWSAIGHTDDTYNDALVLSNSVDGASGGILFKTHTSVIGYTEAIERMRITSNGNVGIGIGNTAPTVQLDISGTDAIKIPVGTTDQRPTANDVEHYGYIRYNTTNSSYEGFGAGNAWGSLGGVINVAKNTKIIASSPNANSSNNQLQFFTATAGSTTTTDATERMRIDANGTVGIGTTDPCNNYILDVGGESFLDDVLIKNDKRIFFMLDSSTTNGLQINSTTVTGRAAMNLILDSRPNDAYEGIHFRTNGDNRMVLNNTGQLGIGTFIGTNASNSPQVILDISGTDAIRIPKGDTSERPTANAVEHTGYIRYNSELNQFEGFWSWECMGQFGRCYRC